MKLQQINELIPREVAGLTKGMVAGYVGGVYHDGQQASHAWGAANLATSAAMTTDTGWLLGSITKVLTATLIMRLVDQGRIDLDKPAVAYLPEFKLKEPGAAEKITVRHLLNHSNGIDADTLMPSRDFGPRAVETYVDALAGCGTLFDPGTLSHYTNPGFALAGRIIERIEGIEFNKALERDLYAPLGMVDSSTSATQAILRRTAIGAFATPGYSALQPTRLFMLPVSAAGAGATPIVTVGDLLTFARMHLAGGRASNGKTYLSPESAAEMRAVSHDLGTPNCAAAGLGWRMPKTNAGETLGHGGGSPGGISSLVVFPEHDLAIVGFATGPGAAFLHDAIIGIVLKELLGITLTAPFERGEAPTDLSAFEGDYRSFQSSYEIKAVDGKLQVETGFEPHDDEHREFLTAYSGGSVAAPPSVLEPINATLFAPAGAPLEMFHGIWGRMGLTSFHNPDPVTGKYAYRHSGWRAARRA